MQLNVNPSYRFEESASIMPGEQYEFRGKFYSEGGLFVEKYTTVHGCDSVYQLFINVEIETSLQDTQESDLLDDNVFVYTTSGKLVCQGGACYGFLLKNTPYIVVRRGKDGAARSETIMINDAK